ncbi:hypothetical protein PMAYCL1PPCAC_03943, partial [Pristionchus mayeri]
HLALFSRCFAQHLKRCDERSLIRIAFATFEKPATSAFALGYSAADRSFGLCCKKRSYWKSQLRKRTNALTETLSIYNLVTLLFIFVFYLFVRHYGYANSNSFGYFQSTKICAKI